MQKRMRRFTGTPSSSTSRQQVCGVYLIKPRFEGQNGPGADRSAPRPIEDTLVRLPKSGLISVNCAWAKI